jgi:hypothetical protein
MSMTKIIVGIFLSVFSFTSITAQHKKSNPVSEQDNADVLQATLKAANGFLLSNQSKPGIDTLQNTRAAITPSTSIELKREYYWLLGELFYKSKNYTALVKHADSLLDLQMRERYFVVNKRTGAKAFGMLHQTQLAEATNHFQEVINLASAIGNKILRGQRIPRNRSSCFPGPTDC